MDIVEVVEWSPEWTGRFHEVAGLIRKALGSCALRIDHIGSTAITGLPAKPVVDIQISVKTIEPAEILVGKMTAVGCVFRPENPHLTKLYFREPDGYKRTHIHMRACGGWHEQQALLFRDYLRAHAEEHAPYADLKRSLAVRFRENRAAYTEGKNEHIWGIIQRADHWALRTGWKSGAPDA